MIAYRNFIPEMVILFLSGIAMLSSYLHLYFQPWYKKYDNDPSQTRYIFYGDQNTQQFITMNLYLLTSFFAINTYKPFKVPFREQYHLYVPIGVFGIVALLFYFASLPALDEYLGFTDVKTQKQFEFEQFSITMGISVVVVAIGRISWLRLYF